LNDHIVPVVPLILQPLAVVGLRNMSLFCQSLKLLQKWSAL